MKKYLHRDPTPLDEFKKDYCLNRIKNFDKITKMKEDRLRLGCESDSCMPDTSIHNNENKSSKLEDFYIESIQAKLALLDEIEASGGDIDG